MYASLNLPRLGDKNPRFRKKKMESTSKTSLKKRILVLKYLKSLINGKVGFVGGLSLAPSSLFSLYNHLKLNKRSIQLFTLSNSIANLLDLSPTEFANKLILLMIEYESYLNSTLLKRVKNRLSVDLISPSSSSSTEFVYLEPVKSGMNLNYLFIFSSFSSVLIRAYEKIDQCDEALVYDLAKFDDRIIKIVNTLVKELGVLANDIISKEFTVLME